MGQTVADRAKRRIIGLTGGIATGKTTVSDYIASRYGLPVLDADVYARQAVKKGSEVLSVIAHRYGPSILRPDGTLDRSVLGNIIFNNTAEKQWVEGQIHPYVRSQFASATASHPPTRTLIYSIPLLFEANLTHLVTEIWVVSCTLTQQLHRLMERNTLTQQQAQVRINAQMSLTEKCKKADHVLDNSQSKESLFQQIDRLIQNPFV